MSDLAFSADQLLDLANGLCNETLGAAERARLEQLLTASAAARVVFADYMFLHSELYWTCAGLGATGAPIEDAGALLPPAARALPDTQPAAPDEPPAQPSGLLGFLTQGLGGLPSSTGWFVGLVAVAMLSAATTWWFAQGSAGPIDQVASGPAAAAAGTGQPVARITGTRNCQWAAPASAGYGTRLDAGRRLELRQGLAEITFDDGAKVILEGPARFRVESKADATLQLGRLAATVPHGAEGFTVETSRLKIVDLGTEFGLVTNPSQTTEVHVFQGEVEGHVLDATGRTVRMLHLTKDQGARLDQTPTRVTELAANADGFVRSLASPDGPRGGLLAQEAFYYPTGPLAGRNGGFGWGEAWFEIASDGTHSTNIVAAGNLTFAGLIPEGNRAAQTGQRNRIRRTLDTSLGGVFDRAGLVENQDGVRLIGRDGTTVYLSFLQRASATDQVFYGFGVHRGDGNANRVLCIGPGAAATGYGVTSRYNGGENLSFQPLGKENTEVNFFVVRFTFAEDNHDSVVVYRNPASQVDESRAAVSARLAGNFAFDRIGCGNFDGAKVHDIDQIRIGTSFRAVTGKDGQGAMENWTAARRRVEPAASRTGFRGAMARQRGRALTLPDSLPSCTVLGYHQPACLFLFRNCQIGERS